MLNTVTRRRDDDLSDMRAASDSATLSMFRTWARNESLGRVADMLPEEYAEESAAHRMGADLVESKSISLHRAKRPLTFGWTRRFLAKLVEKGSGSSTKYTPWGALLLRHYGKGQRAQKH